MDAERRLKPRTLTYNVEAPPQVTGVYACRVESGRPELYEDAILLWDANAQRWFYLFSDQGCRKYVAGWIGPLQRLQPHHLKKA